MREWLVLAAAVIAVVVGWQQISDERDARKAGEERIALEERRAQAEKVAAWVADDEEEGMTVVLSNTSEQPVYQVIAWRVAVQGAGAHTGREQHQNGPPGESRMFATVPPGEYETSFEPGFSGMGRKAGVEIAFRDQAGVTWLRSADGELVSIKMSPGDFYGLPEPLAWEIPAPVSDKESSG